jgi:hypothetical protein
MKQILTKDAAPASRRTFARRPPVHDDTSLNEDSRALLKSLDEALLPIHLACRFPRIMNRIAALWKRPAHLDPYFDDLLTDKRGGRQGFPFEVARELLALREHYQTNVFPRRECVWQKVYSVPGKKVR